MTKHALWGAALGALALFTSGCTTTGAAREDVTPAEPRVEVRDEVGENGLLTPRAILTRYVDALGGEEALRAHRSSTTRGKMIIAAMGMEGDMTIHAAAPDKMVMEIETGMGSMNQGYNGEIGWSDNPMTGAQILQGGQLVQMKQQADFYLPLNYDAHFSQMETVEETTFNGQETYKVRLLGADDRESFHYFSQDSALLVGMEGRQDGPMGESDVTIMLGDYMDFGGVKTPTTTMLQVSGMEIEQKVETVTFDDVAAGAFEPPDSVQAQLGP